MPLPDNRAMIRPWILAARPKTLPAAAAPVVIAAALAFSDGVFSQTPAILALVFALLIQIATNYANDYGDFVKGADTAERQGPARAVASGMVSAKAMLRASSMVFAAAFIEGCFLFPYGGWPLVLVGAFSVLCGIGYSCGPSPFAYNGLADLLVMVFFGIVAVTMTYYVQAGHITLSAFLASLAPGALSVNILAVNNYRDHDADKKAGRRTLVVRFGRKAGAWEYLAMLAIAHAVPVALWAMGRSCIILLPVLSLPLALMLLRVLIKSRTRAEFDKALGGTAAYLMIFSILFSMGLVASQVR
ncbi:MAG TPA: 1,4-dihydroxy-2-naphthoate polyprenyltransferase [Opitutales bacterium]|nr:1,4-dihydroxy-2-naphthoate polyprenyltransferase [Opitutales bacterium]